MIKTILFILFFIVIGVSIFVLVAVNSNTKSKKGMVDLTSSAKQKKKINTIAGVALVASSLLALLIPSSFHQVEAGEVAVVKTLGKVNGIRMPGTYFDFYLFNDYIYFIKTYCMFPKEFYTPFITTFTNVKYTNKEEDTFYNPVLLIPSYTKREEDGTIVVFKPISFIKYENKIQFNEFQNSPVFNHICKLDWSSKSWKTFYDVVQSYGILTNRTTNTLPATLRAVLKNETNNKFINYEKPRTLFANTLKKLHNTFNMDLSDMTSMKLIFTSLGCENLDYLSTKDPTKKMIDDFNKYPELRFLNKSTTQYGMEAAEDLTKDNDEDDPFTEDTNNPENNNDIDTETNESNENDESENDTSSNDEENPFDEPSDNQSSSDYTDNTDTPEEEEADDPVSKVLEIVEDNTLTDYIKREQMIVGINKIIASPPSGLSSKDLKFLKVWATEWINLVSAETTKLILARLLSRPVKID